MSNTTVLAAAEGLPADTILEAVDLLVDAKYLVQSIVMAAGTLPLENANPIITVGDMAVEMMERVRDMLTPNL